MERLDRKEWTRRLRPVPVVQQVRPVKLRPFSDQASRSAGEEAGEDVVSAILTSASSPP
jgi:hypothetical protein